MRRGLWASVVSGCLLGCQTGVEVREVDGMTLLTAQLQANSRGLARLAFDVGPDQTALLATALPDAPGAALFRTVEDASGAVVFDSTEWVGAEHLKTNGGFPSDAPTLNWPVQGSDELLSEGRWRLTLARLDGNHNVEAGPLELQILLKEDGDLTRGHLAIHVVYADRLDKDPEVVRAVGDALEIVTELFGNVGVRVDLGPAAQTREPLAPTSEGSAAAYTSIAAASGARELNLVVAEAIPGVEEALGITGHIPGPLVPSPRSAILVSAGAAWGPDGLFDNEEVRLLGETMAHEVGHFLGLFHPVLETWDTWDNLQDTLECSAAPHCVASFDDHLMFPFPVCSLTTGTCTPQHVITPDQTEVVHRHVAVD